MEETITLNTQEQKRVLVLNRILAGQLSAAEAAPLLNLSPRQVIALAREPYEGCNQQHLRDLLAEREGIVLSRASVHRILQEAQVLPEPKRRHPQHSRRRTR